jgi:hypothetical protein
MAFPGGKGRRSHGLVDHAWDWASDAFDEMSRGAGHLIDNDGHQPFA